MKRASSAWSATDSPRIGLRALHAVLGLLALALVGVLLWVVSQHEGDLSTVRRFDHAQRCIEAPVTAAFRRADLAEVLGRAPTLAASPGCWQDVALPAVQSAQTMTFSFGRQPIGRVWFRVRYQVPEDWSVDQQLTVFVPRAMGWGWRVLVNGRPAGNNLDDWRMTWNRPVVVQIPPAQLRAGQPVDIAIALAYLPPMGHAMSRITVGPADVVGRSVALRNYLQTSMPQACSAVLLLLGAFFFAFWLARRNERAHLLLALASLAWCICNLQYVLPRHDDPGIEIWYDVIVNLAIVWVMWLIYLIVLRFDPRRVAWVEWALPIYVLGMSVLALPVWHFDADVGLLFHVFNTSVAAGITALIVRLAIHGSTETRVIAVALVLAFLAGAHDVALLGLVVHPESIYLLPFGSLLVFGSFLFAVQRRYVRAIDQHEALSNSLAERLARREAELNANHLKLRALEREQALVGERQRLMHDMHDGLGSALLTTLAAVEQGRLPQQAVAEALRSCVEDLRLVIDSLEPMEHNLVTLLATLRYRLGPRMEAAGLSLVWDVDDLPELPWLEAPDVLNVLRLMQEALSNVLKHAHATRISMATGAVEGGVEVRIEDNGQGFDAEGEKAGTRGRGLRSMAQRALRLGGALYITSRPGQGTCLRLVLPLRRD
jgi:signal transduction histidine kinase